jgi:hypothetical protein
VTTERGGGGTGHRVVLEARHRHLRRLADGAAFRQGMAGAPSSGGRVTAVMRAAGIVGAGSLERSVSSGITKNGLRHVVDEHAQARRYEAI